MSDIYVRSYDSGNRKTPVKGIFLIVLFVFVLGGTWWWLHDRPDEPAEEPESLLVDDLSPVQEEVRSVPVKRNTAPRVSPRSINAPQTFSQAQSLIRSGKLTEAEPLLQRVAVSSDDPALKNNAFRLLGKKSLEHFFSDAPSPLKKSYVIQPGDSLDRISRRNKTTVELIRRMNNIDGNLIYPGARIRLPAKPFVVQVDKSARTLALVMDGRIFKSYVVGLGRYGKTPLGTFHTVVHQTNPDWSPPGGGIAPFGDPRNVLGTRWMSFQDDARPSIKGFGIHGTTDRSSIGGDTSNGCVRMLNEDVEEVFLFIPRGTRVVINE